MDTFKEKPKRGEMNRSNANTIAWIVIVVGTVLLISNLGIFSGIWNLWPLALVGAGIWFWTRSGEKVDVKHEHYSAALDNATSARVKISLPVGETTVREFDDVTTLIDADMNFIGDMLFDVQGDTEKTVTLRQTGNSWRNWANPANWKWDETKDLQSTIRLNKTVPMDLDIHGGVGQSTIDLSRLQVNHLDVNGGVGEVRLTLPTKSDFLDVRAEVGVGRIELDVPATINCKAHIKGGVGEARIHLPADAAVRLEASSGIGEVKVGSRFERISGYDGGFGLGKEGIWETANFKSASHKITIRYEGGIGQLVVR
jgi:predicted membrane protein